MSHSPGVQLGLRPVRQICAFPAFNPCRVVMVIAGPIAADGRTVFAVDPNDPRNILAQPIDGGTPSPLTQFTDKEITDFSLSPDRTQIAITRLSRVSDVVLIKGLKEDGTTAQAPRLVRSYLGPSAWRSSRSASSSAIASKSFGRPAARFT